MNESRIYSVEFKHPHFGWLDHDVEFASFQAAMDHRNTRGSDAYRYRIVSRSPNGGDWKLEYKESRPRRS